MTRTWLERLWYPEGDRGLSHALAAVPLAAASVLYRLGAALRPAPTPTRIDGAFVVSVGSILVGGSGKTPVAIHLARLAIDRGKKVGVLSRGYGRRSTGPVAFDASALPPADVVGDEPRLIARRTGASVFVDADRVAAARAARDAGCDFLVLDDGFQHRALARDLDLVVVDEAIGVGTGHLLPWGPLREPASALARAGLVWHRGPAGQGRVHADHRVRADPLLAGRDVFVLAGVARPATVAKSAAAVGANVTGARFFPDHHRYTDAELAAVKSAAGPATIVTTEKDAERLPPGFAHPLILDTVVTQGEADLLAALKLS